MTNKKQKIAVIGAGISGLTCAYELKKAGHEVTVFERNDYVGGRMASRVKDGLIFDIGANHLCGLYTEMKKYCAEFAIPFEPVDFLVYYMVREGGFKDLEVAMSKLTDLRLLWQMITIGKGLDFFNLTSAVKYDKERSAYDDMKRKSGKEAADYLADGLTTTYQFHSAKEMSVGGLKAIMQSFRHQWDGWFLHHLQGGMSALPEAFAKRLNVRLRTPVFQVKAGHDIEVTLEHGVEKFDAVVIGSTATQTLKMYENPTQEQKTVLEATKYAKTISLAFEVDAKLVPDISVVWTPFAKSKLISGYTNEKMKGKEFMRNGKSLVCVWLHEAFAETLLNEPDEHVFARVAEEFIKVCPWFDSVEQLKAFEIQRWFEAMPKFYPGFLRIVKRFLEKGQGDQKVYFTGDYLNSPWTEGALRCGQRVAREVNVRLA